MTQIIEWFQNASPGEFLLEIIGLAIFVRMAYEILKAAYEILKGK